MRSPSTIEITSGDIYFLISTVDPDLLKRIDSISSDPEFIETMMEKGAVKVFHRSGITDNDFYDKTFSTKQHYQQAGWTYAIVIGVELIVLIGYIIWLATSGMAGSGDALSTMITGPVAVPFWIGVVLVAFLIPLGLEIVNRGKSVETKSVWRAIMTSSMCVILGGLVLRVVIVIGCQL